MTTTDRTRFWDRNWNLLYDSLTATQTPEEFIREHDWLNTTVDTADGQRWIGRWINNNGDIEQIHSPNERELTGSDGSQWIVSGDPNDPGVELDARDTKFGFHIAKADIEAWREYEAHLREGFNEMARIWNTHQRRIIEAINAAMPAIRQISETLNPDLDTRSPRADGRPHPPRPSTTPPMWANNPNQQRRRR